MKISLLLFYSSVFAAGRIFAWRALTK